MLLLHRFDDFDTGEHINVGGNAELHGLLQPIAKYMGMGINQAGQQSFAAAIDDLGISRNFHGGSNILDFAVAHQHRGFLDHILPVEHPHVTDGKTNEFPFVLTGFSRNYGTSAYCHQHCTDQHLEYQRACLVLRTFSHI